MKRNDPHLQCIYESENRGKPIYIPFKDDVFVLFETTHDISCQERERKSIITVLSSSWYNIRISSKIFFDTNSKFSCYKILSVSCYKIQRFLVTVLSSLRCSILAVSKCDDVRQLLSNINMYSYNYVTVYHGMHINVEEHCLWYWSLTIITTWTHILSCIFL